MTSYALNPALFGMTRGGSWRKMKAHLRPSPSRRTPRRPIRSSTAPRPRNSGAPPMGTAHPIRTSACRSSRKKRMVRRPNSRSAGPISRCWWTATIRPTMCSSILQKETRCHSAKRGMAFIASSCPSRARRPRAQGTICRPSTHRKPSCSSWISPGTIRLPSRTRRIFMLLSGAPLARNLPSSQLKVSPSPFPNLHLIFSDQVLQCIAAPG